HFHIGSQVTNIRNIKTAIREASQFYVQLYKMGLPIEYIRLPAGPSAPGAGDPRFSPAGRRAVPLLRRSRGHRGIPVLEHHPRRPPRRRRTAGRNVRGRQ
ncbi:MAG: hypothetical protein IIU08_05965, partial [Clostridia bacterium]|nr:hypothetical protein [Clostridia bacterium]